MRSVSQTVAAFPHLKFPYHLFEQVKRWPLWMLTDGISWHHPLSSASLFGVCVRLSVHYGMENFWFVCDWDYFFCVMLCGQIVHIFCGCYVTWMLRYWRRGLKSAFLGVRQWL